MVRFKNRYIAAQVETSVAPNDSLHDLNSSALYNSIISKVQQLHGDFGSAAIKVGFSAKYFNQPTRMAIIRVRHGPHKFVISSLPFVNEIDRQNVVIHTLYVGATLVHCNKFLQRFERRKVEQSWMQMKPAGRKKLEKLVSSLDVPKRLAAKGTK